MTTQDLIWELRHYNYRDVTRQITVDSLTDDQLAEILGDATTWNQAWVRVLKYERAQTGRTSSQPARPVVPAPKVFKMTTADYRSRMAPRVEKLICWEWAIEAFGATGVRTGKGERGDVIVQKLRSAGALVEKLKPEEIAPEGVVPTVAVFAGAHTTGNWLVMTRGHAFSMKDGVVYDIDRSATVKRIVESAYRVTMVKKTPTASGCTCNQDLGYGVGASLDPAVFGHQPSCPLGGSYQQDPSFY